MCNANKGAGDNVHLRDVKDGYTTRDADCPFCHLGDRTVVAENLLAVLIENAYPVTSGHLLAIPRRHVADYFDLHQPERNALDRLIQQGRAVKL